MITIRTAKGKFFFSSFISLSEEKEAQIDETLLSLLDLKYLLTAIETTRLESSIDDLDALKATIVLRESSSGEGGVDVSQLATKTELADAIAGKADRTELSDYATVVSMTQLEGQVLDSLSNKVDKVEGKGLSTEDFTAAYKTKLDDIDNQKLDIPTSVSSSTITTPTVNSIPLYTLGNNGDYVLCTPDAWLNINGLLVPGYNSTTVQG